MPDKLNRRNFLRRVTGTPVIVPATVGLTTSGLWVPEAKASEEVDRLFFFCHGTSVQVEFPERTTSIWRPGWGTQVSQATGLNWFHFAVPTPRSINQIPFTCNRIWLDCKVDQLATITAVHVYDGGGYPPVKEFNGLSLSNRDQWYQWDVGPFLVVALGVSVRVDWTGAAAVLFRNAGAWFECPEC
jgi:hypothetical protein